MRGYASGPMVGTRPQSQARWAPQEGLASVTAPAHFMTRTMVTRYSHGVPTEVACVCGGCDPKPFIYGHGVTLTECSTDLRSNFAEHSGATL